MAGLLGSYKKGDRLETYRQGGGLLDVLAETELGQGLLGLATDPVGQTKKAVSTVANKVREANRKNKEAFESGNNDLIASRALDYSQDALGFAPIGMTVWHGSPHKFDKFDMSKIGTGEGAQAYGHGLYTAESPAVAKDYQMRLGDPRVTDEFTASISELSPQARKFIQEKWLSNTSIDDIVRSAKSMQSQAKSWDAQDVKAGMNPSRQDYINAMDEVSGFLSGKQLPELPDPGYMYKVDIPDEAVARFLDWDKPLSQQAPEVLSALNVPVDAAKRYNDISARMDALQWVKGGLDSPEWNALLDESKLLREAHGLGANGEELHQKLFKKLRKDTLANNGGENLGAGAYSSQVADYLRQQGIPGIRYLDGGSRSAGQGSSNFVLFSDDLPRILEINGQATGNQPWARGEWGGLLDTPVSKEGPRAEAMRIAQANAAKPIEEGGLGLRPDNTPMERAKAMGFDINGFHGTVEDVSAFDPKKYGSATGAPSAQQAAFIAKNPDGLLKGGAETASQYARIGDRTTNQLQKDIAKAERRGNWDEYESLTSQLEDYEIGKVRQAESAGESRDKILEGLGVLRNAYGLDGVESLSDFMRFHGVNGIDMYRSNFKDALAKKFTGQDLEGKARYFDKLVDSYRGAVVSGLDSEINHGANVMPLMVRSGNATVKDFGGVPYRDESFNDVIASAFKGGADTAVLKNTFDPGATSGAFRSEPTMLDVVAVKNPANIRSRFAAFDPARRHETDLLGFADPRLLALIAAGTGGGLLAQD